jgi:hypothetical protein
MVLVHLVGWLVHPVSWEYKQKKVFNLIHSFLGTGPCVELLLQMCIDTIILAIEKGITVCIREKISTQY